jgi:hypothetical protein
MKLSRILSPLLAAAALALALALLDKSLDTGRDWLAYFWVTLIGGAMVYGVWRAVGRERLAAPITAAALRLGVGVALMLLLPVVGYAASEEHQSGYFYWDAQKRDVQAWGAAQSGAPLVVEAFSGKNWGDQYGGMLLLSAFIYRTFSPDFHRPFLILILNAAAAACSVLFTAYAVRRWFGNRDFGSSLTDKSAWLMALYPEAVMLGATHMREAYLIPLLAMMLFGLARIQENRRDGWAWLLIAGFLQMGFSPLALVAGFVLLLGFWILQPGLVKDWRTLWKPLAIFGCVVVIGGAVVLVTWSSLPSLKGATPWESFLFWMQKNIAYQGYLAERGSGILQDLQRWVGPQWAWLVTMVYGMGQPVFPAVVGDPDAAWIMRLTFFFRGAGWYVLALFLMYAAFSLWQARSEPRRLQLIWLLIFLWGWIAFTALIGGGDQWDTPRYRTFLLPWMTLLAAWAWQWALVQRDRWLWRWLAVEAFFVLSFMEWYITRYTLKFLHTGIREMVVLNLVVAGVILGSGWIRRQKRGGQ